MRTDAWMQHCVLYSPGQCAIKAVQDYFTNGTLPAPGTVCEQDFDVFSGKTVRDSFGTNIQTTNETSTAAKRSVASNGLVMPSHWRI